MRLCPGLLVVFVCLLLTSVVTEAATRYISDQLSINMRRGPGTGYRIMELLDTGDKLQTLAEDNGWTKIRTADGETGFVLTRFLSDQAAARTQLSAMQQQTQTLKSENADLKNELSDALNGSKTRGDSKRKLLAKNKSLASQLQQIKETSSDAIRIGKENKKYRKQLLSMRSENARLRHANERLQSRREGMKIGALIMVGGIVVGLLLPLFRRRRNGGNWDSL